MNISQNGIFSYVIAVLLFVAMMPAISAEVTPWSASEALKLSDNLFSAARKLSIECRQSPPKYEYEGTSGHSAFRYHVKHFVSVTNDLSQALESGASEMETQPIYDESVEIMGELRKYASGKSGTAWPAVVHAVDNAEDALTQLGTYYSRQ